MWGGGVGARGMQRLGTGAGMGVLVYQCILLGIQICMRSLAVL